MQGDIEAHDAERFVNAVHSGRGVCYIARNQPHTKVSPLRTKQTNTTLRFGRFMVDVRARELFEGKKKINVQQQPMQVLLELLEQAGEVVTREELRSRIWPADTFVDFEHSLNTAIKKLRQALRDRAGDPRYIETLPRRGYRFLAAVEASAEKPRAKRPGKSRLEGKVFVLQASDGLPCTLAPKDGKCLEEWERLQELGDDVGISIMIGEKRLLLLESGNRVRLLSVEGSQGWCEARILEGEHYGKTALVSKRALRAPEK